MLSIVPLAPSLYLPQYAITSKKKTMSTPVAALEDPTEHSPPFDVRSTVLNPSAQDRTTILVAVPINTPIPDSNNTPVDPTEAFKTIIFDIP